MSRSLLFILLCGVAYADEPPQDPHTIVVTATREAKLKSEVLGAVEVFDMAEITATLPSHPSELLNRSAGVHVNNLGGEGHMTAIRQPITTSGVYLFLEDGIPTRPTGLFNHNALYEINVPQAERVEIIKGPGSALYGSDSIGGLINVITQPSPTQPEAVLNPEYGSHGWRRLLASAGMPFDANAGFRVDLNVTDNDGYRDASDYHRYAMSGRLDGSLTDRTKVKTILGYTEVDQSGISGLEEADYRMNPRKNRYHNDIGRRQVQALRLSTEFAHAPDSHTLYTVTPFFRHNKMQLMPSWMLSYDPNDRDYQFQSYGLLTKYRRTIPAYHVEIIMGMDIDYTSASYRETQLSLRQDGDIVVASTATGRVNYDFDTNQLALSPYLHGEWQPFDRLRLTGGLRYDYFYVDYTDNLDASIAEQQFGSNGFNHTRPDSQSLSYSSLSPKLGMIYQLTRQDDLYLAYRHSFRAPSVAQLFRAGSNTDTTALEPVSADSLEIGLRGQWARWLAYDVAAYHMVIRDDIVSYIDNLSSVRRLTNAGKTVHRGVELGLRGQWGAQWRYSASWSVSDQEYKDYTAVFGFPASQINYAGNELGKAPTTLGNLLLEYRPLWLSGMQVEFEWAHVGGYYTDETNTQEYGGHDRLNLRLAYELGRGVRLYGRVLNIADSLYSSYTSNQVGDPDIQYRPGLPRTFYLGCRLVF